MGTLDGKVAIVTGSSRGIGKGIALVYAREGAKVAVAARSETEGALPGTVHATEAEIRASGGSALAVPCDVSRGEAVRSMVGTVLRQWGRIDILVNSSSLVLYTKTIDTEEERWEALFDINVKGAFLLTKAVLPHMMERRSGHIIHLTGLGAEDPALVTSATGASKAAVNRFAMGVAREAKKYNVAVNLLDPGAVKTERATIRLGPGHDWAGFSTPTDIGPMAVWMACQDASTLTGQIVRYKDFKGA